MKFEDVITAANNVAVAHDMPLVFGDEAVQNMFADTTDVDFFTLDVTGGRYDTVEFNGEPTYSVVIRCMGTSHYMRSDADEINTLIRTDRLIREMAAAFICKFELSPLRFTRVFNEYSSVKSGWEIRFDLYHT